MTKTTSSKAAGLDFSTIDITSAHDRGFEVQVRHPVTDEPLPAYVTLLGEESRAIQSFIRNAYNEAQRREDSATPTLEELEDHAISKLIAATVSWRGVQWGDEELECTPENCRRIYSNHRIRRQLLNEMAKDANFPLG